MTKLHAKMVLNNIYVSRLKMSGYLTVGENKSSITWTVKINSNKSSSKTFSVCDRDNNHGICRLGLTRSHSPFEITLENVGNTDVSLKGEIQFCNEQSTLFTAKFGWTESNFCITNSNPLKWTSPYEYDGSVVKLKLESPSYIIDQDCVKDDNAAKTKDTARKETSNITTDLEKLLTEGKYSDVEIICVNGEILKCHRNILSARSPVLEAMFSNDFKEVSSGQIKLDYFDTEVVKVILSLLLIFQSKIHWTAFYF